MARRKKDETDQSNQQTKVDPVDEAITALNEKYGENTVIRLNQMKPLNVNAIPTGALSLDLALGVGGIPEGRIIEIFGPESSGKSTLALNIVKECQKMGQTAAYIDVENGLDPEYAASIGVNIDKLLISQPNSGEEAFDIAKTLAVTNKISLIVIDSVAALMPRAEEERDIGTSQMGSHAKLMSTSLRQLNSFLNKTKTAIIFINQIRMKIGVRFGNPETTTGGRALAFYASLRLDVRAKEKIIKDEVVVGNRVRVKIVKNKVAPPFREAFFDIIFGKGIKKLSSIAEAAQTTGVITKEGLSFVYKGEKIAKGLNALIKYLKENKDTILESLVAEIKTAYANREIKRYVDDDETVTAIASESAPAEEIVANDEEKEIKEDEQDMII